MTAMQPQEYLDFLKKFEAKKTTDDCYTPADVYQAVLNYAHKKFDLAGKEIMRPFIPNGDYQAEAYADNAVVIDNPPFSRISEICKFYLDKGVKFFLFAPHLTLFCVNIKAAHVVCGADVTYDNGAKVSTSFISNMFDDDIAVITAPELFDELSRIDKSKRKAKVKYRYPDNLVTVSSMRRLVRCGINKHYKWSKIHFTRQLDAQKPLKKAIYGAGYLISDTAARQKADEERAAMQKKAEMEFDVAAEECYEIELSERERELVRGLEQ